MKVILIIPILLCLFLKSWANINNIYVSSKQGLTVFEEGGWDTLAEQQQLDDNVSYILERISMPPGLKIFVMLGAYGMALPRRNNTFITVSFDSLRNTDTLYDQEYEVGIYPSYMYPGDTRRAARYLEGGQGLKISYSDNWDTVNYYNHLLSVIDYAIRHIEEIKKRQQRICLPGNLKGTEISILTYDTARLNAIPITDWGFSFDPKKRVCSIRINSPGPTR